MSLLSGCGQSQHRAAKAFEAFHWVERSYLTLGCFFFFIFILHCIALHSIALHLSTQRARGYARGSLISLPFLFLLLILRFEPMCTRQVQVLDH